MRPVFKDPTLQREFDEKGYAKIPFLTPEQVEHLKGEYFRTLNQREGNLFGDDADFGTASEITYDFTFIDKSVAYKQLVFDIITKTFMPLVDKWLDNYKPIIANYIHKENDGGEVPLHQNWAFVDEVKYTSVSVWCPLVDSNEKNGTLQMVDGSHKRFGKVRGPMVPWELEGIKDTVIGKYLTPMIVNAGEAVVLDDSIVHYSNINKTPGLRLAIQLILIPSEVPSIHYHMNPMEDPETVHVLEVDRDFYMSFNPWMKPKNVKHVDTLSYKSFSLNEEEFSEALKGPKFDLDGQKKKPSFFQRLFSGFSKS